MSAKSLRSTVMCLCLRKSADGTVFTTRLYSNLLIEESSCIHYRTPIILVSCETGSQGLIRTAGFGFVNGMRNPMNPKTVSVC